jgi:hypothetical protein
MVVPIVQRGIESHRRRVAHQEMVHTTPVYAVTFLYNGGGNVDVDGNVHGVAFMGEYRDRDTAIAVADSCIPASVDRSTFAWTAHEPTGELSPTDMRMSWHFQCVVLVEGYDGGRGISVMVSEYPPSPTLREPDELPWMQEVDVYRVRLSGQEWGGFDFDVYVDAQQFVKDKFAGTDPDLWKWETRGAGRGAVTTVGRKSWSWKHPIATITHMTLLRARE